MRRRSKENLDRGIFSSSVHPLPLVATGKNNLSKPLLLSSIFKRGERGWSVFPSCVSREGECAWSWFLHAKIFVFTMCYYFIILKPVLNKKNLEYSYTRKYESLVRGQKAEAHTSVSNESQLSITHNFTSYVRQKTGENFSRLMSVRPGKIQCFLDLFYCTN